MNAYKKYLRNIVDGNGAYLHRDMSEANVFHVAFGRLARNARGWLDLGFEIRDLPELVNTDKEAAYTLAVSMLHNFYNKAIPEITLEDRQDSVWLKKMLKKSYKRRMLSKEFYEDFATCEYMTTDGEEIIPLIHGGDWGRIQAALTHGRGYRTESYMSNPRTKMTEETGLMFHSKYSGRAHYYADSAASQRAGVRAVLMAMVQRKYVYQNEDRDEYSLPTWHYDKIIKWEVVLEWEGEYHNIEEYYEKKYRNKETIGRIKQLLKI